MTLKTYLTRNGLEPLYRSLMEGAKVQVEEAKKDITKDIKDNIKDNIKDDIKDDIKTEVIGEIGDIKDEIKDDVIAEIGGSVVNPISDESIDDMFNTGAQKYHQTKDFQETSQLTRLAQSPFPLAGLGALEPFLQSKNRQAFSRGNHSYPEPE